MKKLLAIIIFSTFLLPLVTSANWSYQVCGGRGQCATTGGFPTQAACNAAPAKPSGVVCQGTDGPGTPPTQYCFTLSNNASTCHATLDECRTDSNTPRRGVSVSSPCAPRGSGGAVGGNYNTEEITYTLLEPIAGFLPATAPSLEVYLAAMFRFIIALAGLLAVIKITWCGFNLMMSVSPSVKEEARECVKLAIFGLLLALGSFLILNSIRVGAGGETGLQNPFTLPAIGGGGGSGGGGGVPTPGTPFCTIFSSNVSLFEGQTTSITAECPTAAGFIWTSSPGAPVIQNNGGFVTFPTAGVYTYTVQGTSAAGTGAQSQSITIRVVARTAQACSQDMPQEAPNLITCAQTNTQLNWSALGSGERETSVVVGSSQSLSILFTTAGVGAYGFATTSAVMTSTTTIIDRVVDPQADPIVVVREPITVQIPANENPVKYANISKAMCDFRYENLDRRVCASYGDNIDLRFQVGGGTPPASSGAGPGCILEPNTAYIINIRNENPTVPGLNTCPLSATCEFNVKLFQSLGAQFTPEETGVCAVPGESPLAVPPPTLTISSPADNAVVLPGQLTVSYAANAPTGLGSLKFEVYDLQLGTVTDRQNVCTSSSTSALGIGCMATATFPTLPPTSALSLRNTRTGQNIDTQFSCANVATQNSAPRYMCSAGFELSTLSDRSVVRISNSQTGVTTRPNILCGQTPSAAIPLCQNPQNGTVSLKIGPGQGRYRVVATACGDEACVTQTRTVVIENPCARGQVGLTCFEFPNGLSTDGEICAPVNGLANTIPMNETHAYHVRLTPGESARLIVANRPGIECPFVPSRVAQVDLDDDDYVWTMAAVDVRATPSITGVFMITKGPNSTGQVVGGSRSQGGYQWRQVLFATATNQTVPTQGWVYEHLLQKITDPVRPRGDPAVGANWCSLNGMASTSLTGTCDYVRNESLKIAIGTTPGDASGMASFLGQSTTLSGICSTRLTGGSGHFEIMIKTVGPAGPNECIVSPDTDYYVNIGTGINDIRMRPRETQEDYVVLLSKLPPPPAP